MKPICTSHVGFLSLSWAFKCKTLSLSFVHTLIMKTSQQFSKLLNCLYEASAGEEKTGQWTTEEDRHHSHLNNTNKQTNKLTCGCISSVSSVHSGFFTCCPVLYKTTDKCKTNTKTGSRASLHADWASRTLDCDSCFNFSHTSSFSGFNLNAHFTSEN